ncbi:MYND finger [Ancylostoma caninum]|uniref:MYND finger n=1 Tax=Ancylostoma caninum TaxID=29170 RepID=A0A368FTM1_ANCCA|nr:MYND finger [Ancylostoma caninum]
MTTLIREQPFSAAVESSLLQSVCHGCFSYCRKEQLKCCSGCSAVYYCGVQCQRNDWPDHSAECRCLKNYSPRVPSCFVRLLARFYWKMSTHGSDVVSFNSRCCYDLLDSECTFTSMAANDNFCFLKNIGIPHISYRLVCEASSYSG